MQSLFSFAITLFLLISCMAHVASGKDAEKDLKLPGAKSPGPLERLTIRTPRPSRRPTGKPIIKTAKPSFRPSARPTATPSKKPVVAPVAAPVTAPYEPLAPVPNLGDPGFSCENNPWVLGCR